MYWRHIIDKLDAAQNLQGIGCQVSFFSCVQISHVIVAAQCLGWLDQTIMQMALAPVFITDGIVDGIHLPRQAQ